MNDTTTSKPSNQQKRANLKAKLKIAMASFCEYSEDKPKAGPAKNSFANKAEPTPDKFRINLTNLSPSAEEQREKKQKFTFLQDSQKFGDYAIMKLLAQGSFGKVYHVKNEKNNKSYAMKVLNTYFLKRYNKSHEAYVERFALANCKHENIVKFSKCFAKGDSLCFLLELCTNGTLQDYIKTNTNMNRGVIKYFAASIVNGLEHLQSIGIIHRDLKPCNILLDKDHTLKITDFGTAKIIDCKDEKVLKAIRKRNKRDESRSVSPTKKHSFVGTNHYISPEVLKGHEPSPAIDLWSLGIIIYQMFTGQTPFQGENEMMMYESILDCKLSRPKSIPDDAWELIKSLLVADPMKRIGYNPETNKINYSAIKNSAFFKGINFKELNYSKAVNAREASVSFGDCSTTHHDNEMDKSDYQDGSTNERDTPLKSVTVPFPEEDEDDFFTDNFNLTVFKTKFINPCEKEREEVKIKHSSHKNLIEYLKDDHFSDLNRKYSCRCDPVQSDDVPLLFDEESDGMLSSKLGFQTSSKMIKHKSCAN